MNQKARRLLIPYIFISVIWVIPISIGFFRWDLFDIFQRFVLGTNPSQLWFLLMLFVVFAIAWPINCKLSSNPVVCLCVAAIMYVVGIIGNKISPNFFCVWTACQYVIYFEIGYILYRLEKAHIGGVVKRYWWAWIGLNLISFFCYEAIGQQSGILFEIIRYGIMILMRVTGAVGAVTLLHTLAMRNGKNIKNILDRKLSKYTMPMYLLHQQIIYLTIYWLNGKVNPYIHASINFLVAVFGSFIISFILMRWKGTRFLIGEK